MTEPAVRSDDEISAGIGRIWAMMQACVERGLRQDGELPGGLRVRRRAPALHARLRGRHGLNERDVLEGIALVESSVNEIIAKRRQSRFVNKEQQMRWNRAPVQPLLDVRTAVLNLEPWSLAAQDIERAWNHARPRQFVVSTFFPENIHWPAS